jgi:hypothetical protein
MSENPDDVRAWFTIEGPGIDFSEFVVSKRGVSIGRGDEKLVVGTVISFGAMMNTLS